MPGIITMLCSECGQTLLTDVQVATGGGMAMARTFAEKCGWTCQTPGRTGRGYKDWCKTCTERRVQGGETPPECAYCSQGWDREGGYPHMGFQDRFGHTPLGHKVGRQLIRRDVKSGEALLAAEREEPGWTTRERVLKGPLCQQLYLQVLGELEKEKDG